MRSFKDTYLRNNADSSCAYNDIQEQEVDPVELIYRLIENIKWIIFAALVGLTLSIAYTKFFVTPIYEATTKLFVQDAKSQMADLSSLSLSDKLAADYLQVFDNWHVHDAVIQSLDLPYSYEEIEKMLTVSSLDDTHIIAITIASSDPKEAYNIACAYAVHASAFIEDKLLTGSPMVFEDARIPIKPSSPNILLNAIVGVFLGMGAMVGIIFVQFVSDDRIHNGDILQRRLGLATLGMMPLQGNASQGSKRKSKGDQA